MRAAPVTSPRRPNSTGTSTRASSGTIRCHGTLMGHTCRAQRWRCRSTLWPSRATHGPRFASGDRAFAEMPTDLRTRLLGLQALHVRPHSMVTRNRLADLEDFEPRQVRPVVGHDHHETGARAISGSTSNTRTRSWASSPSRARRSSRTSSAASTGPTTSTSTSGRPATSSSGTTWLSSTHRKGSEYGRHPGAPASGSRDQDLRGTDVPGLHPDRRERRWPPD